MAKKTDKLKPGDVELVVCVRDALLQERGVALSERLNTRQVTVEDTDGKLVLFVDADGLVLSHDGLELRADLSSMIPRLKQGKLQKELLVKAAKIKGAEAPLRAVDATAGLGEDAILLAAAGFEVTLYEQNLVIAALLEDSLQRALQVPELYEAVSRMHFVHGDSIVGLRDMQEQPDVVLLDPMFPERRKSASVKKKFQLLHLLEMPCSDELELLEAAISAGPRKVIIKRPPKGPFLADKKPSYSLDSKAVRYDVLAFAR